MSQTYVVRVGGQVSASEINALSPLAVTVQSAQQAATVLAACCDQAGLIGLLRYLHGLGLVLLSVERVLPR